MSPFLDPLKSFVALRADEDAISFLDFSESFVWQTDSKTCIDSGFFILRSVFKILVAGCEHLAVTIE